MLLTLFAGVVTATADNTVSVGTALIPQGKTGSFSIELTNSDVFASSLELHMTLPEGITFESVSLSDRFTDNPSLGSSTSGQAVTITTLSTTNAAITGNSGPLLFITVSADAGLEVGTILTASVTSMELAMKVDGHHESFNPDPFDFDIEITDRIILDENSTLAPTAQSGANVLVKRTIKKDTWNTLVLPFSLKKSVAENAFGTDAVYYKFSGFETTVDVEGDLKPTAIKMNFTEYKFANSLSALTAGQPFLIKTSIDVNEFTADNVKIVDAVSPTTATDVEYDILEGQFTGTFVKTKIPEDGLFISDDQFWYSTGETTVKAFRGWFDLDVVLNQAIELSRITMNFIGDGESMGISDASHLNDKGKMINDGSTPSTGSGTGSPQVYDLQGRCIQISNFKLQTSKLKQGIYIVNGKKVVK